MTTNHFQLIFCDAMYLFNHDYPQDSLNLWSWADPAAIRGDCWQTLCRVKRGPGSGRRRGSRSKYPLCLGKFCISKLNSRNFGAYFLPPLYWKSIYSFPIKTVRNAFFFFFFFIFLKFLSRSAYENMSFFLLKLVLYITHVMFLISYFFLDRFCLYHPAHTSPSRGPS